MRVFELSQEQQAQAKSITDLIANKELEIEEARKVIDGADIRLRDFISGVIHQDCLLVCAELSDDGRFIVRKKDLPPHIANA